MSTTIATEKDDTAGNRWVGSKLNAKCVFPSAWDVTNRLIASAAPRAFAAPTTSPNPRAAATEAD
ncbi:MAG: hypothetical protein ABL921_29020, partial [Pirellula sp.]